MGDDRASKDLIGEGWTIRHDDGTVSHAHPDLLDDGWTIRHEDGGEQTLRENLLDDGLTLSGSDGSRASVRKNLLDDGYTVSHRGGGRSLVSKDMLGEGYTIRQSRPRRRQQIYYGATSSASGPDETFFDRALDGFSDRGTKVAIAASAGAGFFSVLIGEITNTGFAGVGLVVFCITALVHSLSGVGTDNPFVFVARVAVRLPVVLFFLGWAFAFGMLGGLLVPGLARALF